MIIENAKYSIDRFSPNDLCIFAIGYERRSYYLLDSLIEQKKPFKSLVFAFDDYQNYDHTRSRIDRLKEEGQPVIFENYSSCKDVQSRIIAAIKEEMSCNDSVTVHIDYSSMPRSWYCRLPIVLEHFIRPTDTVYFWYSEGEYPSSYEEYPSAGIDSFSFFSGKPSLQIESSRIHILGLGYDAIRSQAIISITDPDYLIACFAYSPKREVFSTNLKTVNSPILSRAAMVLCLHLNDFSFMISKLCETANELLSTGDVIFIPDGPKPLIFAMSLIPDLIKKNGVSCLHVSRNSNSFEAVDVAPTKTIYGFFVRKSS